MPKIEISNGGTLASGGEEINLLLILAINVSASWRDHDRGDVFNFADDADTADDQLQ